MCFFKTPEFSGYYLCEFHLLLFCYFQTGIVMGFFSPIFLALLLDLRNQKVLDL